MKILICGGHLTPALAVAEAMPKGTEVLYVGRKNPLEGDSAVSLEYKTILQKKIPFVEISTGRLQRKLTKYTFSSLLKIPKGLIESFRIINSFKPDVIVGFGSYVSVPVCLAGFMMRIPVIIHEQTLEAGLANKFLGSIADKICVSWENSLKYFPKNKTILTGNPVFSSLFSLQAKKNKTALPQIVVVGGSQGSHAINQIITNSLDKLLQKFNLYHQTGDAREFGDFEALERKKEKMNETMKKRYFLTKFINPDDIGKILADSDLVITRAGINTIGTIAVLNKPALVIPLPASQRHEQKKNALFLKSLGLAEVVYQDSLTPEKFVTVVELMMKSLESYKIKNISSLELHKNSAKKIVDIIFYAKTDR